MYYNYYGNYKYKKNKNKKWKKATGFNPGYYGKRMSNRAVEAYMNGEKPISRWSKADIICKISIYRPELENLCKKLLLAELKDMFLYKSSWHHTGEYFRHTDFYSFNYTHLEYIEEDEIVSIINERKERKRLEKEAKLNG